MARRRTHGIPRVRGYGGSDERVRPAAASDLEHASALDRRDREPVVRQGRARLQRDRGARVPEAGLRGDRRRLAGTSRSSRRRSTRSRSSSARRGALSEQELLDALGEETARLLRSAREASDDIRKKAEERAARLVEEASGRRGTHPRRGGRAARRRARPKPRPRPPSSSRRRSARRWRCSTRPRPKPRRSSSTRVSRVARCSTRRRRRASACSAISFAGARCSNGQIEALRGGRDRLLDAYRTVKGTFLEATEALAQVEARAAVERSASTHEPVDVAAEIAEEIEKLDGGCRPSSSTATAAEARQPAATAASRSSGCNSCRPRRGTTADDRRRRRPRPRSPTSTRSSPACAPATTSRPRPATADAGDGGRPRPPPSRCRASSAAGVARRGRGARRSIRCCRPRSSGPSAGPRTTRTHCSTRSGATRAARPPQQVLGDADVARKDWAKVLRDAIDRAYGAGRVAAGRRRRDRERRARGRGGRVGRRCRCANGSSVAIDSGDGGDTGGLVERIGARYREWKNQSLEQIARRSARRRRGRAASTTRFPTKRCCGGSRSRKAAAPTATTTRSSRR